MPRKILIVEDEFIIAHDLKQILENLGYYVTGIAVSADLAFQEIDKERPDIVLLDIILKGPKTGIDIGKQLNDHYKIPFIFITSHADKTTISKVAATNPYGYILKPFGEKDIYAAIELGLFKSENERLTAENSYLIEEINREYNFEEIIGKSAAIQQVFKEIEQVAPTNSTVLIHGETGTGKELVARALHHLSERKKRSLIKINCAALPPQLIESELFGHEKGAFTGANDKRIGKFELANQGTIFLDEIGELPLELQPKLLRCIQEKEIERIGGNKILQIDVRLIAATNRDLEKEVNDGNFRADLFYRLNVFPLRIPPLRERKEDIEILTHHFLEKANKKLGKNITKIPQHVLDMMNDYHWPGNIRELQHIIERGAIHSTGEELQIPELSPEKTESIAHLEENGIDDLKPLKEVEKDHILRVLELCKGKIRGDDGAAKILDIQPNTLDARLKKMGIKREFTFEK
ncbi:MAG: sigma-54 dependent transcriptional regulator [Bacteroidota bacterium]